MDEAFSSGANTQGKRRLLVLVVLVSCLFCLSTLSQAQTIVVSDFPGQSKKVASNARQALVKALSKHGVRMLSYNQYLHRAKRHRIPQNRALWKTSVQVLARDMGLDGVVVGSLSGKSRQQRIEIFLFDYTGRTVLKKVYSIRRRSLPRRTAHKLAKLLTGTLQNIVVAKASSRRSTKPKATQQPALATQPPTPKVITPPAGQSPQDSGGTYLPKGTAQTPSPQPTSIVSQPAVSESAATQQQSAPALVKEDQLRVGSVPNVLLTAGISGNIRSGLSPLHETGMVPGLKASGRAFLATFVDIKGVNDIGVGGSYHMALGLEYGLKGSSSETWKSSQSQWEGEIIYRLAFNHLEIAPAFLIRLGYGATSCTHDTDSLNAVDATYKYPYGMLDVYLTLFRSLMRLYVTGGYMYLTEATLKPGTTDPQDWSGSGFTVKAGVDLELVKNLHIGIGYDLNRFMLKKGIENRSDTYHAFLLQIGWRKN